MMSEELEAVWHDLRSADDSREVWDVPVSELKARKSDVERRLKVLRHRRAAAEQDLAFLEQWAAMGERVLLGNAADTVVLCADLEACGYATIDFDDGREVAIRLTEAGRKLLEDDGAGLEKKFDEAFPGGDLWRGGRAGYLAELGLVAKSIFEDTRA